MYRNMRPVAWHYDGWARALAGGVYMAMHKGGTTEHSKGSDRFSIVPYAVPIGTLHRRFLMILMSCSKDYLIFLPINTFGYVLFRYSYHTPIIRGMTAP